MPCILGLVRQGSLCPLGNAQMAGRRSRQAGLCSKALRPNIAVKESSSSVQVGDASGTDAEATAMSVGLFSPEISTGFTVAPEVVYSPIVPVLGVPNGSKFATNKFLPEIAMPDGSLNPETSAGFTIAPEVVYS